MNLIKQVEESPIVKEAWQAWEEDQKTNPKAVNPQAFVYGYKVAASKLKQKTIAFAKWLNHNGYKEYDESDKWINFPDSRIVYTTEELYVKFEKENLFESTTKV